jgi:hypothetical protein
MILRFCFRFRFYERFPFQDLLKIYRIVSGTKSQNRLNSVDTEY